MRDIPSTGRFGSGVQKIFPGVLLCLLIFSCNSDQNIGPFTPPGKNTTVYPPAQITSSELQVDISLSVYQQAQNANSAMLAAAMDDSTSDSTHLYIDVEVINVTPQTLFFSTDIDSLALVTRVTFVDYPHYKNFSFGRLRLVVGQTLTGLQVTEVFEVDFSTDTTIVGFLPISRIDSFLIADNVAVYGRVLQEGRFFEADLIRLFDTPDPPTTEPEPVLVGFVTDMDITHNRLYVNDATIIFSDSARVESPDGEVIPMQSLKTGENQLTVTALAYALNSDKSILANGWEFNHFILTGIRKLNQ
jgi:hypothetical protein